MPYLGNMMFGPPTLLLKSAGENNYYPSYSPDGQLVVFDRAPLDTSVPMLTGCNTATQTCPNDSFSNPAARLMVMKPMAGGLTIDLTNANGSPLTSPVPLSNSWPKWSPFLQHYRGDTLLWLAFSTTRDYGVRVLNHKMGMTQCYPADSYETPGAQHGQPFAATCQQPQLWMAAVDVTTAMVPHRVTPDAVIDPSKQPFWLPFQDITSHNHTPQWTQRRALPPDAGVPCQNQGGNCMQGGVCCAPLVCMADGTCKTLAQ
jgi:hypothetical protein